MIYISLISYPDSTYYTILLLTVISPLHVTTAMESDWTECG